MSNSNTKLPRSAKVTFNIESGADILAEGQSVARALWNHTCWCLFGHNEVLRKIRGDSWERYKRNQPHQRGEGYPGFAKMDKELRDYWAAKNLSDRCFTYTLKQLDVAMRSWFSNLRQNPKARPPKYSRGKRQLTFEVGRNAKPLGDWRYRLTVLGGRGKGRHAFIRLFIRPGVRMRDIKLIRVQPDLTGTVVYYIEQKEPPGAGIAGIDLGIVNLAAVAFQSGESILYSGKGLLSEDRRLQMRAKKCKPANWKRGQKRSYPSDQHKAYRRKAGNIRKLATHNVTTNIIEECIERGVGKIVIGDLTDLRKDKDFGSAGNQKLHAWTYREMRRQIEYKAEEYSIEVEAVDEAYTSQACHRCGVLRKSNRKHRGLYVCDDCGVEMNADVNGAFNILNKVSPAPAYAGVGVGADLPGPPSPLRESPDQGTGTGKARRSQISPTYVAKFDLRDFSVEQRRCNRR